MAKIIRIVSADGKKVISRILPAVPSHFRIPRGSHVEIVDQETGKRESIGRYVNEGADHARKSDDADAARPWGVTIEYVEDWDQSQQWLDHMAGPAADDLASAEWFHVRDKSGDGDVLGFDQTPLLIGGLAGAGAVAGVAAAGGGGKAKDTVAPVAPTGLDLATEDDSGSSTTDNVTSVSTGVTISGTAEAGSSVELFDGTTSLGKATADATGKFTLDVTLTAGVRSITAKATDSAGNVSAASSTFSMFVDQTAPTAATTPNLAAADDTGASSEDNLTSLATGLTFTGNTDPGVTVELLDNGTTSLGTVIANSTGGYSIDIALAEGSHSVTAVARDTAGNAAAASAPLLVTVDRTLPLAPFGLDLAPEDDNGASSTDNITSLHTGLTVSGSAEAGSTVIVFDGTTAAVTVVAGSNGLFSADLALTTGIHDITARAVDAAGNSGPSSILLAITIIDSGAAGAIA